MRKGLGKAHLKTVLRSIGVARPACYRSFPELVDSCVSHRGGKRSYVLVTPRLDDEGMAALDRLRMHSDADVCVLYEDEEEYMEVAQ